MTVQTRQERERAARRQLIVSTARAVAESEGWDAVTTRRLSSEIEYSQPVLYQHFRGLEQIAAAVAVDGFAELGDALRTARLGADSPAAVVGRIGRAYLDFAAQHPAVYEAMFTRSTTLAFAAESTPPQLTAAFAELQLALAGLGEEDAEAHAEVFFAALHGLVALNRAGRLRPDEEESRLRMLVATFTGTHDR